MKTYNNFINESVDDKILNLIPIDKLEIKFDLLLMYNESKLFYFYDKKLYILLNNFGNDGGSKNSFDIRLDVYNKINNRRHVRDFILKHFKNSIFKSKVVKIVGLGFELVDDILNIEDVSYISNNTCLYNESHFNDVLV